LRESISQQCERSKITEGYHYSAYLHIVLYVATNATPHETLKLLTMSDVAYILTEPNAVERVSLIKEYANHIKTIQVERGERCEFASDWCISMPATRVQIKLSNRDKGELLVKSPRMFTR
jgi:hypothetical protein